MQVERMYSAYCEQTNCLNAIAEKSCTRDDVAGFYADCIRCSAIHGKESINWSAIAAAIVARWSRSALVYIKEKAWKQLQAKP